MVKFFHVEKDATGRTLSRSDNERLSVEFVVSVAIDESADPDDRIEATRWLGRREECHGFFHAIQLAHIQSPCRRIRDNACVNLLCGVSSDNLLLYVPDKGFYRERLFKVMQASNEIAMQWTLLIIRYELGEKDLHDEVVAAYAEYEKKRNSIHRLLIASPEPQRRLMPTPIGLLRQTFRITLGLRERPSVAVS